MQSEEENKLGDVEAKSKKEERERVGQNPQDEDTATSRTVCKKGPS